MRHLAALALSVAVAVSPSMASPVHVHEYLGHDHPEHHHGPATHQHRYHPADHHHSVAERDHGPAIEAGSCDPGQHAVSINMACACVCSLNVDLSELPGPTFGPPGADAAASVRLTEVRVHGPPFAAPASSRAPPGSAHA